MISNSRRGKPVAKNQGDIGVIEPVTREHYQEFFSNYRLIAIDSRTFGDVSPNIESEVMIFRNKDL